LGIGIALFFVFALGPTTALASSPGSDGDNTARGAKVVVSPVDNGGNAGSVSVTFASVSGAGETAVSISDSGPGAPDGFALAGTPAYYQLSTTAAYSGPVSVCLPYDTTAYPDPRPVQLFHWNGVGWDDITSAADAANATICGDSDSLALFIVAGRTSVAQAGDSKSGALIAGTGNDPAAPGSGGIAEFVLYAGFLIVAMSLLIWWRAYWRATHGIRHDYR